jgi:hypothetical protein
MTALRTGEMSMVERFPISLGWGADKNGVAVWAKDYDALAAELAAFEREYPDHFKLKAHIRELEGYRERCQAMCGNDKSRIRELEAENERLLSLVCQWSESCTGRNGSQAQCVEATADRGAEPNA